MHVTPLVMQYQSLVLFLAPLMYLTYWDLTKMDNFLQIEKWIAFPVMKMFEFPLEVSVGLDNGFVTSGNKPSHGMNKTPLHHIPIRKIFDFQLQFHLSLFFNIDNKSALAQVMAWHPTGEKPLLVMIRTSCLWSKLLKHWYLSLQYLLIYVKHNWQHLFLIFACYWWHVIGE